jgi:hypothetical protein
MGQCLRSLVPECLKKGRRDARTLRSSLDNGSAGEELLG